jgi:hypothetical protein
MAPTDDADVLRDELLALERGLAVRDGSGVPGGLAALIAPDFVEFGQSGRRWDGAGIVALLATAPGSAPAVTFEDFAVDRLADDVTLVTYRLSVPGQPATNRSSVWLRRDGRWRLRFHQGTRVADEADRTP